MNEVARLENVGMSAIRIENAVPDYAICTLSKFLRDCIALINDEVLVEDLEGLSTIRYSHDEE